MQGCFWKKNKIVGKFLVKKPKKRQFHLFVILFEKNFSMALPWVSFENVIPNLFWDLNLNKFLNQV